MERVQMHYIDTSLSQRAKMIWESIDEECRPDIQAITLALATQENLDEILEEDTSILHELQKKLYQTNDTTPIVVDIENCIIATVIEDRLCAMIPVLGCTMRAFDDLFKQQWCVEDAVLTFTSDSSWVPYAIFHAEQNTPWTYDPEQISPEEYLTAAILVMENEPIRREYL